MERIKWTLRNLVNKFQKRDRSSSKAAFFVYRDNRTRKVEGHKVYSGVKDSERINESLEKMRTAAMDEYYKYNNNGQLFTYEYLKQYLDDKFKLNKKGARYINEYFVEYINDKSNRVADRTSAKYRTFYKHLTDLQEYYKLKLTYNDFNLVFYNKFVDYFVFVKKHENRTIKEKHISVLKSFINWSVEKSYIEKNPYQNVKVPFKISPADTVSLAERELSTLYDLELDNERLIKTRDIFCLSCFCGLRFSDMDKILPENIKGNHLQIFTQKTLDKLIIPLWNEALKLIHKYFDRDESFPTLSNQKLNDYVKELCELANSIEPISIMRISGKNRSNEVYEKYKLISSHTARRTFATLAYLRGINPYEIMKITGHKDLKTFQIYLRLDMEIVSKNFLNAHNKISPPYSINEIIANLLKLKVDKIIIAEAIGLEIETISY